MTALLILKGPLCEVFLQYTAISRKVVGRSAHDSPERYCGWFWVHCSSKKFERIAWETMDICLRMLKESNKSRFHSYSVRNNVLIISHIAFGDCRVHIFFNNLSRNSLRNGCICITPYNVTEATTLHYRGPEGTPFEGGVFTTRLVFPPDYPLSPPKMRFTCEMFHPNGKWKQKHS